jgi:3-oxoadipate enol-lactonase
VPHVTRNGCRLWYDVKGEGDFLLQIGGAGFAHMNFGAVTDVMAQHFRVIEVDQRGNGFSDRPDEKYTIEGWADDMAAVLDEIRAERIFLHGTSTGGMIAIKLAAKQPERIRGLILGATAAKLDFVGRSQFLVRKALARAYGTGSAELAHDLATLALSRNALDQRGEEAVGLVQEMLEKMTSVEGWCAGCDAMVEADLRDDLQKITAPTLVMAGELDNNTPLDAGPQGAGMRYIAEKIPNAELHIIPGCGHTNLVEEPEISTKLTLEFFDRVRAAGG